MAKRTKRAKCQFCGTRDETVINDICESCEDDHVWCCLCEEWYSTEGDQCRHLFWDDAGWGGAGTYESEWDRFKEPFMAFLDMIAKAEPRDLDRDCPDLITAMQREIAKDAFFVRLSGSILSVHQVEFCRMRPDLPKDHGTTNCLPFAILPREAFDRDNSEAGAGFDWLKSLQTDDTKKANAKTAEWIREWRQAQPKEAATCLPNS